MVTNNNTPNGCPFLLRIPTLVTFHTCGREYKYELSDRGVCISIFMQLSLRIICSFRSLPSSSDHSPNQPRQSPLTIGNRLSLPTRTFTSPSKGRHTWYQLRLCPRSQLDPCLFQHTNHQHPLANTHMIPSKQEFVAAFIKNRYAPPTDAQYKGFVSGINPENFTSKREVAMFLGTTLA